MSIKFKCRGCGKSYQVAEKLAGKKAKCPDCKNVFAVPHGERRRRELQPTSAAFEQPSHSHAADASENSSSSSFTNFLDDNLPAQDVALPPLNGSTPPALPLRFASTSESVPQISSGTSKHVDVKTNLFGFRTRYELAKSPFGSPVLKIQRYLGRRAIGRTNAINLSSYEIMYATEGTTIGSFLSQVLFGVVVLAIEIGLMAGINWLSLGIFGALLNVGIGVFALVGLPGLTPHWQRPAVAFASGETDGGAHECDGPTFEFSKRSSVREFKAMMRSSTRLRVESF